MGFFDGISALFTGQNPMMGDADTTPAALPTMDVPDGGLLHPPAAPPQPGFLQRITTPDPNTGLSFMDKLGAMGGAMRDNGDPAQVMEMMHARQDLARQQHERAVKNAAFRAAYQNGKFDPTAYVNALGNTDIDPAEIAKINQNFAPKRQIVQQGRHVISVDPQNPTDQQPVIDFPEETKDTTTKGFYEDEDGNWHPQPGGPYDPAYIRAAAAAARKPGGAKGGGGISWLPPGAHLVAGGN